MTSRTTAGFWRAFEALPDPVKPRARETFQLFRSNPSHPSLHFKKVHPSRPIYSVRITLDYRALGVLEGEEVIWFWIGNHAEYERRLP